MALSVPFSITSSPQLSKLCCISLNNWKQNRLEFLKSRQRKGQLWWIVKSVVNNRRSSGISDNGATEPARVLLERLFAQTQKLEEQIGRDPHSSRVAELGLNLGKLELDLHAALSALKEKEEDMQDAERKILLEYNEINHAKKDLEQREEEIVAARLNQEKLEEGLKQANMDLASQATEIVDLKLRLKERDQELSAAQLSLSLKEEETGKVESELMKKCEEAANAESELRYKAKLLDEANKTVEKQEVEIQQLQRAIQRKEEELEVSKRMQESEAEILRVTEAKLEKQTMDWLVAQEELKRLAEEKSRHIVEANETLEEFESVRKLLSDVRSALVSSQKALVYSREKMGEQEQLFEKQLAELEELRSGVKHYMTSLRNAATEVESERVKLRVAEAQNTELLRNLSIEKELVLELRKEIDKERLSLKEAIQELSSLQEELEHKNAEFEEKQILLLDKESELAEARHEIQNLKAEQASLQLILEQRDLELSCAKKMLEEVNQEIAELKGILSRKEDELIQAIYMLEEKDEHVQTMHLEINHANLKFSEAQTVMERIVDLTKEMVQLSNDECYYSPRPLDQSDDNLSPLLLDKPADSLKWQKKQLENELEFTRENLRTKEMEVLAAQRDLAIKEGELKMVLGILDAREKEISKLKEEVMRDRDDLKQLYVLAQEIIGENSVGDLMIEKLQLEAAQLVVEAATSALHKITELSRELLANAGLCIEAGYDTNLCEQNGYDETLINMVGESECSGEIRIEVSRLLTLTEQLVKKAGIAGDINQ